MRKKIVLLFVAILSLAFYSCEEDTGEICFECDGLGLCTECVGTRLCMVCYGGTDLYCSYCRNTGKCPHCKGSGKCPSCKGKGTNKLSNTRFVKVTNNVSSRQLKLRECKRRDASVVISES